MSFVEGLPGLLAGFAEAEALILAAEPEALELAGREIADAWVANIEDDDLVLTGRYRDSIAVQVDGTEGQVYTDVPYAEILELGDSRQTGHAVAQRAMDEHAQAAFEVMGGRMSEVLA